MMPSQCDLDPVEMLVGAAAFVVAGDDQRMIGATSVLLPQERRESLAKHLRCCHTEADRWGLTLQVIVTGRGVTVRFCRPPGSASREQVAAVPFAIAATL